MDAIEPLEYTLSESFDEVYDTLTKDVDSDVIAAIEDMFDEMSNMSSESYK